MRRAGWPWFIFLLLFAVGYCPMRFINFPFRVGPHNIIFQYLLALRLCRVLNIILSTQFLFATLSTYHAWANVGFAVCVVLLLVAFAGLYGAGLSQEVKCPFVLFLSFSRLIGC